MWLRLCWYNDFSSIKYVMWLKCKTCFHFDLKTYRIWIVWKTTLCNHILHIFALFEKMFEVRVSVTRFYFVLLSCALSSLTKTHLEIQYNTIQTRQEETWKINTWLYLITFINIIQIASLAVFPLTCFNINLRNIKLWIEKKGNFEEKKNLCEVVFQVIR